MNVDVQSKMKPAFHVKGHEPKRRRRRLITLIVLKWSVYIVISMVL
jgi:hypothetical protein